MFFHVLSKTDFSVLLLVGAHNSFMYFAENNDFLFIACQQHHHPCGKISALTWVLPEEGEGRNILDIWVYIYIRYIWRLQPVGEPFGVLRGSGSHHDPVWLKRQDRFAGVDKRMIVVWIVIVDFYRGIKIRISSNGFMDTQLYGCPIVTFQMLRQKTDKCIFFIGCKSTGIHIGLVVQLLQYFFYTFFACFRHSATPVNDTVYCSHRYIC